MCFERAMKIKKILEKIALLLLTVGATLIVGLLSFSGMYALCPSLLFSVESFALAVAFEGEVYYQNIKAALQKIFKFEDVSRPLANQYLRQHFPSTFPRPQFFRDLEEKIQRHHTFKHRLCSSAEEIEKQNLKKEIDDMLEWFSTELFATNEVQPSAYQKELRDWLKRNHQEEYVSKLAEIKEKQTKQSIKFKVAASLALLASIFMSFGSSYLLLEAFAVIPFTAALPVILLTAIITPLSLIAGVAYGLMTYNALTDMISKGTIEHFYQKFSQYLNKKWQPSSALMAVTELLLLSLIVGLTLCTAGTWRTIVQQTPPLFAWISKIPQWVMSTLKPIILSVTTLIFNVQNTAETLEELEKATAYKLRLLPELPTTLDENFRNTYLYVQSSQNLYYILEDGRAQLVNVMDQDRLKRDILNHLNGKNAAALTLDDIHEIFTPNGGHQPTGNWFSRNVQLFKERYNRWASIENSWQRWNLFRIFIQLTYEPLHHSLFVGHLVSAAVTADRVEGIPAFTSAVFGFLCDGVVDAHYFIPHQHDPHDHGILSLLEEHLDENTTHDHHNDFPTRVLKIVFYPIHVLADSWDWYFSKDPKPLSLMAIWKRLMSVEPILDTAINHLHANTNEAFIPKRFGWEVERTKLHIERFKAEHLEQSMVGNEVARKKIAHLTTLQNELSSVSGSTRTVSATIKQIKEKVQTHLQSPEHATVYNQQRFFSYGKTSTSLFLEEELLRSAFPARSQ